MNRKEQHDLADRLLARACEQAGVNYSFAFEASKNGRLIKTPSRVRMRWKVWKTLYTYGLSYSEIAAVTGADHTSVMYSAQVSGWYVRSHTPRREAVQA